MPFKGALAAEHTELTPGQDARIVALSPALTKQLYLLGLATNVVGITSYCPQPPGNLPAIEQIGSVVDPSTESIIRLRPDLVVSTPLANRRRLTALRGLGIPIAEFLPARSFADVCAQFLELGRLTGTRAQAERIVTEARTQANALSAKVANRPRPSVFVQIGAKPLAAAGKDSFMNDLVVMAGGSNIADDTTYRIYSREAVLAANPDCILIVTMGITGTDEKQQWSAYPNLNAAANQRIYMIDSELVCSPTPQDFVEALAAVIGLLHPETAPGTQP